MQVQTIASVVPSPDGQWVAYTQSKPIVEPERSETVSQIYLARQDGSRRFQLTRGEHGSTNPAFSPDGRHVYFTSDRSGKSNLYRILVEGGEAEKLTDFKGSLGEFRVSTDGKSVAYVAEMPRPLELLSNALPLSYAIDGTNRVAHSAVIGHDLIVDIVVIAACLLLAITLGAATLRRRSA